MATASETIETETAAEAPTETQAETATRVEAPLAATFPAHRVTIERYRRLVESGVYRYGEPVFLWRGRLVEKMGKGRPHTFAVNTLTTLLVPLVPAGHYLQQEGPIAIGEDSVPEPDLTVIRGTRRDHLARDPTAQEVALIVEVADSSLRVDSGEVLEVYAAEAIPVYWLVNIPKRRVEVYRNPTGPEGTPGYRECRQYGPGEDIPVVLDGVEVGRVAVDEVLPRS